MNKTVSLLIVSLLGLAVLFSVTNKSDDIVIVIGDEPLAELPVEEIHSIHIESIDDMDQAIKTLHLKRGEKQWLVANEQDYPADSDRILRFINNFIDMKVLREVSASTHFNPDHLRWRARAGLSTGRPPPPSRH